jgi:hypothetical protein
MFSLITTQSSYANYGGGYSNYPQGQAAYSQNLYNQGPPDMSGEDAFMMQSSNRMNQMRQSNRNMISHDRNMMREGYDVNENYYGGQASNIQGSYRSYPNQEQMMRGGYHGVAGQGEYSQSYNNAAIPQSYPLNQNYPNAPRYSQQRGNAPMEGRSQGYSMPQNRPSYNAPPAGYGYYEYPAYDEYMVGYEDSKHSEKMDQPSSYPLNQNYPNAPLDDNQQKKPSNANNKMASYGYQSYPYQTGEEDQYIGDRMNDKPPSSSMNRGVSNTDTNASWDTTDDQTMRQSSANTTQSSQWNKR